jgi:hypothetical protein
VSAAGEPIGVSEDGAHAPGDPKMRAQEHDLHGDSHDPLDITRMPASRGLYAKRGGTTGTGLRQSSLPGHRDAGDRVAALDEAPGSGPWRARPHRDRRPTFPVTAATKSRASSLI